jgi:hypothetical protein
MSFQMNNDLLSDEAIVEGIIKPAGGVNRFRLIVAEGYKAIQKIGDDNIRHNLLIEDDALNQALISYLERHGVEQVPWREKNK